MTRIFFSSSQNSTRVTGAFTSQATLRRPTGTSVSGARIFTRLPAFGGTSCRFSDSRTTAAALGRPPVSVPASSARNSDVISGTVIVTARVATARPSGALQPELDLERPRRQRAQERDRDGLARVGSEVDVRRDAEGVDVRALRVVHDARERERDDARRARGAPEVAAGDRQDELDRGLRPRLPEVLLAHVQGNGHSRRVDPALLGVRRRSRLSEGRRRACEQGRGPDESLSHSRIVCCLSQATHPPFGGTRCKFPSAAPPPSLSASRSRPRRPPRPRRARRPRARTRWLDATAARWTEVSRKIWDYAETALVEHKSAALLEEVLEKEGFAVTRGVAGMPTAFVATAGSGAPVVAILAEYDALPGLSQKAGEAKKSPAVAGAPGQGCGHNLLGTAAVAAAVAANRERVEKKLPGTIRVYGTPAEEQILGKTFMLRDGVFAGTDVVLAWHPEAENYIYSGGRLAITALDVEFFGKTAHAAANPWLGRSSLDALEVFEHAMSLMREHVLPTARLHRVVKDGGLAANIIPDYAARAVVRARRERRAHERDGRPAEKGGGRRRPRDRDDGEGHAPRARRASRSTTRRFRGSSRSSSSASAPRSGTRRTRRSRRRSRRRSGSRRRGSRPRSSRTAKGRGASASSDTGEVSAAYPLIELGVQTAPTGAPWHHWDVASCAASPMGVKGMLVAAKVLAASTTDLLRDPAAVSAAKAEFAKATAGKAYVSPLAPDAKPKTY